MFSEACLSVHGGRETPLWIETILWTETPLWMVPRYLDLVAATAAIGTHPTGMHSCYISMMFVRHTV